MQDRPDARELLEAVRIFLEEQVVPVLEGTRQFHARVAANVLAIVGREIASEDDLLRQEWRRLTGVLKLAEAPAPEGLATLRRAIRDLNQTLADRIRNGDADDGPWRSEVLQHLRVTAGERLAVANPKYAPRAVE